VPRHRAPYAQTPNEIKRGIKHAEVKPSASGALVCLSYKVPVCVYVAGRGALTTNKFYSQTTTRHVNAFAREVAGAQPTVIPLADFAQLVAPFEIPY